METQNNHFTEEGPHLGVDLTKKEPLYLLCVNPANMHILTTKIDFSHGNFKEDNFSLDQIIRGLTNLKKCNVSHNKISEVSLQKNFSSDNQLTHLNLSHNALNTFDIGTLLAKCTQLKKVNLEHNSILQTIAWQEYPFAERYILAKQ